jgi:hypothetical protein
MTMVRRLWLAASITLARTHPEVVQPTTSSVSTPRHISHGARSVPKNGCLSLPDHVLAGQGRQFRYDLAGVDTFGQIDQSWYLLCKRSDVRAIQLIDDARKHDWQFETACFLEHGLGLAYSNVDIAAAENFGIVEAVYEIDDKERGPRAKPHAISQILLLVNFRFA